MAASVEGTFRVLDRATPALDRIERKGNQVDRTMQRIGIRMDEFGAKTERDMKVAESGVDGFARATERTSGKVTASMGVMERSIAHTTSKAQRDIAEVDVAMATLGAQQANPTVDIDIAGAMAQIELLKKELRSLERTQVKVGAGGIGTAATAAATGGAARPGFFSRAFARTKTAAWGAVKRQASTMAREKTSELWQRIKRPRQSGGDVAGHWEKAADKAGTFERVLRVMVSRTVIRVAAVIGLLGPPLEAVTAAVSGLIGSLGSATTGAAVGLTGMLGVASVGFAGLLGAIVPAIKGVGQAKEAFDEYNKAIEKYGRNSKEAAEAQELLNQTPTAGRRTLGLWNNLGRRWREGTKPGQEDILGTTNESMRKINKRFLDQAAGISNQSSEAFRGGVGTFWKVLDSPNLHRNLNILSNTFADISPATGRIFANFARLITNIAAAARPQVIEFFKWFDQWMSGANKDTTNLDKLDQKFKQWTKDFKLWVMFFRELFKLSVVFFGSGKGQGRNLLMELNNAMREQRERWEKDPSGLKDWFKDQTDNFKRLMREIRKLAQAIGELVDLLSKTIGPLADTSQAVREAVGGGLPGAIAQIATFGGLYLGAKKLGRGVIGGLGKSLARRGGRLGAAGMGMAGAMDWKWVPGAGGAGPGGAGEGFARTAGEGAALGGGAGAGAKLWQKIGSKVKFGAGGLLGGYALAELGRKGLEQFGVGDPTEGQGIFKSLTHGFNTENVAKTEAETFDEADLGIWNTQRTGYLSSEKALGKIQYLKDILGPLQHQYGKQMGDADAFKMALRPSMRALKDAGPEGADIIAQNTIQWAHRQAKENPKLTHVYDRLVGRIKHKYSEMGQHIAVVQGQIFSNTDHSWKQIRNAMNDPLEEALQKNSKAFTEIQRQAFGQLRAFGYDPRAAHAIVQGVSERNEGFNAAQRGFINKMAPGARGRAAGDVVSNSQNYTPNKQAGGFAFPGMGRQDTVAFGNARVAPGEIPILTRHHRRQVDQYLAPYGTNLRNVLAGNKRWHSSPMRRDYAAGGILPAGQLAANMGLSVSGGPGFGGIPSSGHAVNSLHYSGSAYDVSGSSALMRKYFFAALRRFGGSINELFYDPIGWYIDNGGKVPGAIGGHGDHVHIGFDPIGATLGGGGMGGMMGGKMMGGMGGNVKLRAPRTKQRGIPGAFAQRAMDIYAAGMQHKLNRRLGGAGPRMPGGVGGGGGQLGMAQLEMLARQAGMSNPHLMAAIGMAESGGNPTVTNSIGARGLWQIIPSTADAFSLNYDRLTNPGYNAFGAAKILQGQGLGAWEAYTNGAYRRYMQGGGFAGWHAQGGSFTVKKPTLFGAGEAGEEDVKITPKNKTSRTSGKGRAVSVHIDRIENHREGDIRKHIEQEFERLGVEIDSYVEDEDGAFL